MSDLSARPRVITNPLGAASDLDKALLCRGRQTFFRCNPRCVGYRLCVPEVGNYYALPRKHKGWVLIHAAGAIELVSKVCRHRQALIRRGRGSLAQSLAAPGASIVCSIHRWTRSAQGNLLGTPQFSRGPCPDRMNYPIEEWIGQQFARGGRQVRADRSGKDRAADLDCTGCSLERVQLRECNYN
jgi:choline monooxygenase